MRPKSGGIIVRTDDLTIDLGGAIPLIITSSKATEQTFAQHRKLKTRANAYLKKPFSMDALIGEIRKLEASIESRAMWTETPVEGEDFVFENNVTGGNIPNEYISSVEKGFKSCMDRGEFIGFPVVNLKFVLEDGASHAVDSSDNAFQAAARGAFRDAYKKAKPIILEPVMKLEVESPTEFQGAVLKTVMQRRGLIVGTTEEEGFVRVDSDVPLAEMFGYATQLRSMSQGRATYSMEFSHYAEVPANVAAPIIDSRT